MIGIARLRHPRGLALRLLRTTTGGALTQISSTWQAAFVKRRFGVVTVCELECVAVPRGHLARTRARAGFGRRPPR
eukprot:30723-Pelagococcus_subviridis.AAC.10